MEKDEPLYAAAARELQEETSVNPADVLLTQVCTHKMPEQSAELTSALHFIGAASFAGLF